MAANQNVIRTSWWKNAGKSLAAPTTTLKAPSGELSELDELQAMTDAQLFEEYRDVHNMKVWLDCEQAKISDALTTIQAEIIERMKACGIKGEVVK